MRDLVGLLARGRRRPAPAAGRLDPADLPPALPAPPAGDRDRRQRELAAAATRNGAIGYPTATTPLRPLEAEAAVEQQHTALQHGLGAWFRSADELRAPLAAKLDSDAAVLAETADRLDSERETIRRQIGEFEEETPERARRFELTLPLGGLAALTVLMIAEYPILNDRLGRLYNLSGHLQDLASVATLVINELVCGLAGAAIARWIGFEGPRRHRWLAAACAALGIAVSAIFVVGLTLTRAANADPGDVLASQTLFAGLQVGINLVAFAIGYTLHNLAASEGRALRKQEAFLSERLEETQGALHAVTAESEHLRAFDLHGWTADHRGRVQAEFLADILTFRDELTGNLADAGHRDSVGVLELLPLPEMQIPDGVVGSGAELNPAAFDLTLW